MFPLLLLFVFFFFFLSFLDTASNLCFALFNQFHERCVRPGIFNLNCLNTIPRFHPEHIKNVEENEANRFCFALTLRPPARIKVT